MMRYSARLTTFVLAAVAVLGFLTATVHADPVLLSVNVNYIDLSFDDDGGAYDAGLLTIAGDADVVVENTSGQVTYADGYFSLITSLALDNSAGGLAAGLFQGGTIVVQDVNDDNLLTANIDVLRLDEVYDGSGLLAGSGIFAYTGGSLSWPQGHAHGYVVEITYHLDPASIDNFQDAFAGIAKSVTLQPLPEPATLCLLGTGVLGLLAVLRRRAGRPSPN